MTEKKKKAFRFFEESFLSEHGIELNEEDKKIYFDYRLYNYMQVKRTKDLINMCLPFTVIMAAASITDYFVKNTVASNICLALRFIAFILLVTGFIYHLYQIVHLQKFVHTLNESEYKRIQTYVNEKLDEELKIIEEKEKKLKEKMDE